MESIRGKVNITDSHSNSMKEELYNYNPKAFLVVGNLDQFFAENGVDLDKLHSFENYRKNGFVE